jgi:hypothetical protein
MEKKAYLPAKGLKTCGSSEHLTSTLKIRVYICVMKITRLITGTVKSTELQ